MLHDSSHAAFHASLQQLFPTAVPIREFFESSSHALIPQGFTRENSLGIIATCRDEIASPLEAETIRAWGKTYSCRSLGGFLLLGESGIKTGILHAPIEKGRGRLVMVAMPHIGLSTQGIPGVVMRDGIESTSHACGSLAEVCEELAAGQINVEMDFNDLEQSCVRQKVLSGLHYGSAIDLVSVTQLAAKIIHRDARRLLESIAAPLGYDFALLGGILINGPGNQHWVEPYPLEVHIGSPEIATL